MKEHFSVSNISHIKLIIYIRKFTIVNTLGYISYSRLDIWNKHPKYL